MKVDDLELIQINMCLRNPFKTSFGVQQESPILLVRLACGDFEGWGECVATEGPWYSSETRTSVEYIISKFIAPILKRTEINHPSEFPDLIKAIRGNQMAKACVEDALWDLYGRMKNQSLQKLIGGKKSKIDSGISLGIQPDIQLLVQKIENALEQKYPRIKIKIEPGWDLNVIKELRDHFPEIKLMVDANSAYTLKDMELFQKLDRYDLMMVEQPLQYFDIIDHSKLQREISTPICLDESIKNCDDARVAIDIDATRIINVKPARVGGITETLKIDKLAQEMNIPLWCGGMLETGIGRAKNIAVASLPRFILPNDISESSRYYEQYIINPIFKLNEIGKLDVPTKPGLGVEIEKEKIAELSKERKKF